MLWRKRNDGSKGTWMIIIRLRVNLLFDSQSPVWPIILHKFIALVWNFTHNFLNTVRFFFLRHPVCTVWVKIKNPQTSVFWKIWPSRTKLVISYSKAWLIGYRNFEFFNSVQAFNILSILLKYPNFVFEQGSGDLVIEVQISKVSYNNGMCSTLVDWVRLRFWSYLRN